MKEAKKMRISKNKVLCFCYLYRLSQIEHDIPDPLTMEKIFVMLRVTEEKERNFEKRGYMGKKVLGVLTILLILTGCQNMWNEAENLQQVEKQENGEERNSSISNDETETNVTHEKDQELSNGEHIRFQLGSQAKIDAVVDMPDKKWNEFEKCVIEVDGFQGESVFNKILGKIPESGLETRKGDMGEPDVCYSYEGTLGEQLKNQNGTVSVSNILGVETEEGKKVYYNLPVEYITSAYGEGILVRDNEQEISLEDEEKLIEEGKEFVRWIGDWEKVELTSKYSFSYKQMEKQQELMEQAIENGELLKPQKIQKYEWSKADDCFLLFFQGYLNGVPVLCNEINRQDDLYIPSSKIQAVITEGGIQYLQAVNHYAIREKEPVSLAEKDIILETLRNKYDLAIAEPITLDQMKLIYYPMTTGRNETGHWMCDMIPAWQFRFIEDEIEQYVYINALDGREIAG
ncbi:hypothetical protein DXB02_09750 [Blautia sp. OF11-22]|nr:hypothetical protein DXB02_09750 [Blautia sp. OF11-22]